MEGKGKQDPSKLNYDVGLKCWYTPEVEEWWYILGLTSWKQTGFGGFYWQEWRKKSISQMAAYKVWRYVLIHSTIKLHLLQQLQLESLPSWAGDNLLISKINHLLQRPNRWVQCRCSRSHRPCILHVLCGGVNLWSPFWNVIFLLEIDSGHH